MKRALQNPNCFCALTLLLIPIHLIGCCVNAVHSIDKGYGHSYPPDAYVLMGAWLAIVAAIDLSLLCGGRFAFSAGLRRYWLLSAAVLAVTVPILLWDAPETLRNLIALPLMLSPYGILFPLLEGFFAREFAAGCSQILFLFSLLQWALCRFSKGGRAQERT